jgi:hypothetical protein
MRYRYLAALSVLFGGATVGCAETKPTCGNFQISHSELDAEARETLTATVLLVDVSDNSADAAARASESFQPEIEGVVEQSGGLSARLYGGSGTLIERPACFADTTTYYKVESPNRQRQEQEREDASELLHNKLTQAIRQTSVVETGSPIPLFLEANEMVEQLLANDVPASQVSVVLYSDLLSASTDCLNLDGLTIQRDTAEQIVDRCLETDQIEPLPSDVSFAVRGAGDRAETSAQAVLANQLADELCHRLSTACAP